MKAIFLALSMCAFSICAAADDFTIVNVGPEFQSKPAADRVVLTEYYAAKPPTLQFNEPASLERCELNGKSCIGSDPIPLKLTPADHGPVEFKLSFKKKNEVVQNLVISLLGPSFPMYTVAGKSKLDHLIAISPIGVNWETLLPEPKQGNLLVLTPDGAVYFYRMSPDVILDFRPHRVGKKLFFSYFRVEKSINAQTVIGKRVILDRDFKFVRELPWDLNLHEFLMLGEDHFIGMVSTHSKTGLGTCIAAADIVEWKNGKVVFSLKSTEPLKRGLTITPYMQVNSASETCIEPFHLNSIQPVGDDRLLLNYLQFTMLWMKKEKRIEWILRGPEDQFGLPRDYIDSWAHTANWNPETRSLLLFQNYAGNDHNSKVVEFKLEFKPVKKASVIHTIFDSGMKSQIMGSAEIEDGVVSMYLGKKDDENAPDFHEIIDGRETLTITLKKPFTSGYRAYRYLPD